MPTVSKAPQAPVKAASTDERAKAANDSLSVLYKQLNEKWEVIERKLRKMVPPREVFISYKQYPFDDHPDCPWEVHFCLGLVKYRGEWHICHGVYSDEHESEPQSWKPIIECSAGERLETVQHVDELRDKILETAEKSIPEVEKAIAKLTKAVERF